MMTPVSIVKIVASASVLVAACSAAVVFGVTRVQHEDRPAADTATATIGAPQAAPAVRSDAPPAATKTEATKTPPVATESALAAAAPEPAAIAAELAGPPDAAGKKQSLPSFDVVRVEADGEAVVAGRAPPGATVDLMRGGERLDRAVADAAGEFAMVPPRLPAGSYELTLNAKLPDGTVTSSQHGAAVTVDDTGPSARVVQSRAEYVPEAASQSKPSLEARTGKPQESASLQPVHANPASSSSEAAASSSAAGHAISSKIISRGDSLWRISRIVYGDGSRYALVYRANRDRIRDPNLIYPGQTLVLPAKRN
jgi:nucleoid-associated protein YgaU